MGLISRVSSRTYRQIYMANKIEHKFSIPANPTVHRGQSCQLTASPDGTQILYPAGNNIIIRNIENPSTCTIYAEHGKPTSVARYSPNGQWVASADTCGKLKIWNPNQEETLTIRLNMNTCFSVKLKMSPGMASPNVLPSRETVE